MSAPLPTLMVPTASAMFLAPKWALLSMVDWPLVAKASVPPA